MKLHKHVQLLLAALLSVPVAGAQQPAPIQSSPVAPIAPLPPDTGKESGHSIPAPAAGGSFSYTSDDQSPPQAEPDTHVLAGAETFGLGSLHGLRRSFDPAVQVSEFRETGIVAGRSLTTTSLGGSLNLEQHWGRYHLTVGYNGAEVIYRPSYDGVHDSPYDDLGISLEIPSGRWTLRLRDSALYSWGTGFGGLFTGGPAQAAQNSSTNSIQPSLVPNGTIQTGLARQLNNTALGEIDYARSRRTTLTVLGSYGFLFFGSAYIDSQSINGRVGYNYALSAANSISLSYDYNRISFGGASNRLQTDLVQMSFGRKITGRLAFQVTAGPQLLHFENFGLANRRQLSWSAFSALTYQRGRTGYSLSYFRGVTPGSGVYLGSDSETVTATVNREITRFWSASVTGGYAVNKALAPVAIFASQFDDWFAGANLNRQLGAQVRLGVSYGFQQQTTSGGGCPVLSCGLPGSFSQLGVTLQWHPLARGR